MHVEQVVQIPFFQGLPAEALRRIAANSIVLTLERGRILISQHDTAEHLFFLISGVVQFYIHFQGVDDLLVGTMREPGGAARLVSFPEALSLHSHHPLRGELPGYAAPARNHHGTGAGAAASRLPAVEAGRRDPRQ
jgi:hypothetical protein